MKCYEHETRDSVVACHGCGRGLCKDCSNRFTMVLCAGCLKENNKSYRSTLIKQLVLSAVIFFFTFQTMGNEGKPHSFAAWVLCLLMAYTAGSIPFGWQTSARFIPNVILILPLIGWFIVLLLRVYVSAFVGVFTAPFQIVKALRALGWVKETEQAIDAGTV